MRIRTVGLVLARAALGIGLAPLVGACSVHGLAFVQDDRVQVLEPAAGADVTLPLRVAWEVDTEASADRHTFAVLVDRAPPPPGRSLAWLFRDDDVCEGAAETCGAPEFLNAHGVYPTAETELTIDRISERPSRDRGVDAGEHELTIVLLDPDGNRVGESAWSREFGLSGGG